MSVDNRRILKTPSARGNTCDEPEDRDDDESEDRLYCTESGEEVGSV